MSAGFLCDCLSDHGHPIRQRGSAEAGDCARYAEDQETGGACVECALWQCRASFDLRWNADMRAIKRWQAAHPGSELVWPDHADLVVWLLEQLESVVHSGHGRHEAPGE